jgi:hypothetical protein
LRRESFAGDNSERRNGMKGVEASGEGAVLVRAVEEDVGGDSRCFVTDYRRSDRD